MFAILSTLQTAKASVDCSTSGTYSCLIDNKMCIEFTGDNLKDNSDDVKSIQEACLQQDHSVFKTSKCEPGFYLTCVSPETSLFQIIRFYNPMKPEEALMACSIFEANACL